MSLNMHSKTSTSLRRLFRPILRFLGMSSTPPSEVEFPGDTLIEDWVVLMRDCYCSLDPENSPNRRSRMDTLKVTAIRRYKVKKHAEHEYIVAKVSDPDLGQSHYLKIERNANNPTERNSCQNVTPLSSQSSLSSLASLGVLKKPLAHDHVSKMANWPTEDICIDDIKCQDSQMILLDLAIAAKVVHDHSEIYELFKRQCFWYSDVVVAVLEMQFPKIRIVERDPSLIAVHSEEGETEVFDHLSGTYKSVLIYTRRTSLVEEIHNNFVAYRLDLRTLISKAALAVKEAQSKVAHIIEEAESKVAHAVEEAQKAKEEAQTLIEEAQSKAAIAQKEKEDLEEAQKTMERMLKEKEEAMERMLKEKEEALEKMLKENADLKQRMQESEGKVTSASGLGGGSATGSV